jgi:hypothetical protein
MRVAPVSQANRRSFLYRAIQLAALPSFLAACGGGGSDHTDDADAASSGSAATAKMSGQVVLPAGLSLAGTRVGHLLGDEAVASSGAFVISFVPNSAALTQVRDASGNLLLFGFLRAGQTQLSVRSTAEALVFRSLGLWALAPAVRMAALSLFPSENLTTVETAIAAVIAAHGSTWMEFAASSGVGTAVLAKVAAMAAGPMSAQARRGAQGMIVEPTERVSGLIAEGDGIGACKLTNDFRRRALVVHTETRAKLEGAPDEFDLAPNLIETEMDPTHGLSSPLEFIADLFSGSSHYTPVSVNLATPIYPPNAIYTRYEIYAIGPGLPSAKWVSLPPSIQSDGLLLIFKSVVVDFALPFIASVMVPFNDDALDDWKQRTEINDVVKDLVNLLVAIPDLVTKVLAGDFKGCCEGAVKYILATDSLQIACLHTLTLAFQKKFGPSFVIDPNTGRTVTFESYIYDFWEKFDKVLDVGEFAFTLFDTAVQACDIVSSSMVEHWDLTVTKAKVTLNPAEFFIEKNGLFSGITAVSVDGGEVAGKVFGYTWKCSSGHLSTGDKYGSFIDSTTLNSVAYDAAGVAAGTVDQIDVKVFLSGFGKDDPVGSAKTKVYVTGVTVTPTEKKLKANESVTLTAQTVGMRPLAAGETVTYRWTMTNTVGALTAGDTPTATFRADATREGIATVTVEASLGGKRIGTAQCSLTVGTKLVVAGRLYEDHWKDASGCHTGMHIAIPKIAGATSYDVFVSGMRGPVFGTEYHWFCYVYPGGATSPEWVSMGNELVTGIGGGNGGGDECVAAPDQRWAAWYEGSTVQVTVTL